MALADIFKALGDPIRLEIVQRLSKGEELTIGDVSDDLGVTRQGARKHLQVLVDVNMVKLEPKGRDVFVHLDTGSLDDAKAFIAELEKRWDDRLLALKQFAEENHELSKQK
jgi:DNA-binding transcriptional ArsR family regulator